MGFIFEALTLCLSVYPDWILVAMDSISTILISFILLDIININILSLRRKKKKYNKLQLRISFGVLYRNANLKQFVFLEWNTTYFNKIYKYEQPNVIP